MKASTSSRIPSFFCRYISMLLGFLVPSASREKPTHNFRLRHGPAGKWLSGQLIRSFRSGLETPVKLTNAVHIGHSTGGGEVARYVAKFGEPQGRVAKAVLVSSVPPLMLKTAGNPGGTPVEVFDGF